MPRSKGLRISVAGAIIFLPSAVSLLFLPPLLSTIGILLGGVLVWSGFIMTLFNFYSGGEQDGSGES
jgi:hypothetical protein